MLEETEQSKYQFGCLGCMSERIKELPPRLEYEGNGTYYTIITVKLAQEHSHILKIPGPNDRPVCIWLKIGQEFLCVSKCGIRYN